MSDAMQWSGSLDPAAPGHRRAPRVLSPSAAAALFLAAEPDLEASVAITASPVEAIRSFPEAQRSWLVELAVLAHIERDRQGALQLLWTALELDLERAGRPALQLYDLYAAIADARGRATVAALVREQSTDLALLARATLWSDPSRAASPRWWRMAAPDGQLLAVVLTA